MQSEFAVPKPVKGLHGLFDEAVKQFGPHIAMIYEDGVKEPTTVTYRMLASLSTSLSKEIRALNVIEDNYVIGVMGGDGGKAIIAILSIFKLPAAYMYFSADWTHEETVSMIHRLEIRLFISGEMLCQDLVRCLSQYFNVITKEINISADSDQRRSFVFVHLKPLTPSPMSVGAKPVYESPHGPIAFVITTSGSTGTPKVITVPHQCIVPNILDICEIQTLSQSDVVLNGSILTFDTGILQIFLALSCGGTVVAIPDEKKLNSGFVINCLRKHKVTHFMTTPTFFLGTNHQLVKSTILSEQSSLRVLTFAGEPCPTFSNLAKWRHEHNKTDIFNLYGITEVSCIATCYRLTERDLKLDSVPLGTPLTETLLEVRDEDGKIITDSRPGELFIGSVSRVCYIDEEKSLPVGECVYRATGDIVRRTSAGLMILGRKDHKWKERYLDQRSIQIESTIESFPEVLSCKVISDKNESYEYSRLFAFITTTSEKRRELKLQITDESLMLRERAKDFITEAALPEYLFSVPYFPVTPHGKVDLVRLMKLTEEFLQKQADRTTS